MAVEVSDAQKVRVEHKDIQVIVWSTRAERVLDIRDVIRPGDKKDLMNKVAEDTKI